MATFWVSFSHNGELVGVAFVDADDGASPVTVVERTFELGCNRGRGLIEVLPIRSEDVPVSYRNRLLAPNELEALIAGKLGGPGAAAT
jgi:hypothetical protein